MASDYVAGLILPLLVVVIFEHVLWPGWRSWRAVLKPWCVVGGGTAVLTWLFPSGPPVHSYCYGALTGAGIACLIDWWDDGDRRKAARELGEKSLARIRALAERLRSLPQPRPAPSP